MACPRAHPSAGVVTAREGRADTSRGTVRKAARAAPSARERAGVRGVLPDGEEK
ncbi:hypothetical protein GCM10010282_67510 [Streptomyces roseolus]|nr:hypothetical protein GCM10010282_67510 [Streptomyces roseolus]